MEEKEIIELFVSRSENAIAETDRKFRSYCRKIAYNILGDHGETDECVNETYFKLWNSIPPNIPERLSVFIAKIVRNTAFHIYSKKTALRRGKNEISLVLDELCECADMNSDVEENLKLKELEKALEEFLDTLESSKRDVFMLRYWYTMPVREIAHKQHMKEGTVKSVLSRTRSELREFLKKRELY